MTVVEVLVAWAGSALDDRVIEVMMSVRGWFDSTPAVLLAVGGPVRPENLLAFFACLP